MSFFKFLLAALLVATLGNYAQAQRMSKPYKTLIIERQIDAPANRVWEALVLDYGEISNFSPFIYASNYENGSLKGKEGAERRCNFNAKGTRWSHERIVDIDTEQRRMKNVIIDAQKFPLDLDNSYAIYYVSDNGDGTTTAGYEFNFRTKPAFLGSLAKGSFRKSLNETLIGLEHYLETGEHVTGGSDNAKRVLKIYKENGEYKAFVERESSTAK